MQAELTNKLKSIFKYNMNNKYSITPIRQDNETMRIDLQMQYKQQTYNHITLQDEQTSTIMS